MRIRVLPSTTSGKHKVKIQAGTMVYTCIYEGSHHDLEVQARVWHCSGADRWSLRRAGHRHCGRGICCQ